MDREKEEEHLRLIEITRDISNDTYEDRYREVNEKRTLAIPVNEEKDTGRGLYARSYPVIPVNEEKDTGRSFYTRAYPVIPVYHLLAPHFPQPHPIWQEAKEQGETPGCSSVPEP